MGVIGRLARLGAFAAAVVLVLTVAAVLYFSDRNLRLHGGGRSLDEPVDAVLVLGGGVDPDGVPAYSTRRRVAGAVALLEAGRARSIVLSGGGGPGEPMAERMRRYALSIGAPPKALVTETRANSTFENLRFGLPQAKDHGFARLAILTDAFHLERARWLAAYFGHDDIGLVAVAGLGHDSWPERIWHTLREALAWWYNLGKVAAWEILGAAGLDTQERRAWVH